MASAASHSEIDAAEKHFDDDVVDVASLRDGMRLAQDVYDETGVLLLASGMRVTTRFLELLAQRRIHTVRLKSTSTQEQPTPQQGSSEFETPFRGDANEQSRKLDELLPKELLNPPRLQLVRAWRRPRLPNDTLKVEALRGVERHEAVSSAIAGAGETLQLGGKVALNQLRNSVNDFVNMVTLDFDLLPLVLSMQRTKDEYLFDHGVNVSLMSLTIGAQLGLSHHHLMDLALAGLLHDVGMLRVPGQIRLAPRGLTAAEIAEIRKHPLHTLEMLEGIRGLPNLVRIIAYQVHERVNGSGYPRGRMASALHPFSLIVSAADAYCAATRPRPYREALSPYEGAVMMLHGVSARQFDPLVVRALLDGISLVPIGSIVELSSGQKCVVIRANPDLHTRPVVEELDDENRPMGRIIDLAKEEDLRVTRAHANAGHVFVESAVT